MAHRNAELLALQGNCKRDPETYKADFELQLQHFTALLDLFRLKPDQKSPELADLALCLAHVAPCYPEPLSEFPQQLVSLLDAHAPLLHPQLRTQLVQALILLRHKGVIAPDDLLPLCFRLFQCQDKALKALLHGFIVADIKALNTGKRNDRLNRSVQNYLYKLIQGDSEAVVKRALAVVTELWRRQVWRDARSVNVIAAATAHESPAIMLAALKFFLGQDIIADEEDEDDSARDAATPAAPTKDDVYRAYHKGTSSTKKKKIRKIKRVMGTIERSKKRGAARPADSFAAMQLLHDPQGFAERLFARCSRTPLKFDTRLVLLQVISRAIGVHELILENFYPYIQRYLQPSQREVVAVLAVAVQACHKLVPPDVLRPLLKQLVDQFVHDKARPEVMTVGLKAVREVCLRCPLVMDADLLSDLVLYRKERDKHVKNAAKALTALFREIKPSLLEKRERGRGADLTLELQAYGVSEAAGRVDGAELLEAALARGDASDSDDDSAASQSSSDDDGEPSRSPRLASTSRRKRDNSVGVDRSGGEAPESSEEGAESGSESESDAGSASDAEGADGAAAMDEGDDDVFGGARSEGASDSGSDGGGVDRAASGSEATTSGAGAGVLAPQAGSLSQLRKQLAVHAEAQPSPRTEAAELPIEQMRILTQEDFDRIRKLKVKQMVEDALAKHGLKSASARARMKERLFEEMEETLEEQEAAKAAAGSRVDPTSLLGKRRGKADKAERMASVIAGRQDREEFGSSVARKKQKTGGKSNIEKQKSKVVLVGAHKQQAANRKKRQRQRNNPKHQRGRASRGAWD